MILFFLLFILSAYGQEVLVLDVNKVVSLALEQNRNLKKLKREILSLEDIYRAEKRERFFPEIELLIDKESTHLLGKMLLLDIGNRLARIRSAKISLLIKKELLKELERQIKIKAVRLFADLYLAEKTAEVKREQMAIAYIRFDREREKAKRGLSDRVKVAEWERTYRSFRAELLSAQRRYNEILMEIKRFAGIDVQKYVEVDYSQLFSFQIQIEKTIDTEYLLNLMKDNYLLRIKDKEIAYFESKAKEQKKLFYPELYLYSGVYRNFKGENELVGYWNLILRIPLFDGKASFYRERSFLELKRAVEIEKKDISETIKKEILLASYEWEELMGEYESAVAFDTWAQEYLDLSRSNYELELAFDLGYAMSTKTLAEKKLAEVQFRILLLLMKLYALVGSDPFKVFKEIPPFLKDRRGEI